MKRHVNNPNLSLVEGTQWRGLPLLPQHRPYVNEYLKSIDLTFAEAIASQARLCVIRFDLRFPAVSQVYDPGVIARFFHRLQREIDLDQRQRPRPHPCKIRYIWAAERDSSERRHFHVAVFLNKDAYHGVGLLPEWRSDNSQRLYHARGLGHCIVRAWAHALGVEPYEVVGCVHFPHNGSYHISRNKPDFDANVLAAFQRLTYLAKAHTKEYGQGYRSFGCSQRVTSMSVQINNFFQPCTIA